MKKLPVNLIDAVCRQAIEEDVGVGDVTGKYTGLDRRVTAAVCTAKENMVLCGIDFARTVFAMVDPAVKFRTSFRDKDVLKKGEEIFTVKGNAESIVCAERTAINFIGYLSGIATQARQLQDIASEYGVILLDTRKTTPTLRVFEKYAVRCGGAQNHRMGLYDMFLVKENHLLSAGVKCRKHIDLEKLRMLVNRMKKETRLKVEIETENLREFKAVLESGCDRIMLDNFNPADIIKAVKIRDELKPEIELEASGGICPANLRKYARTGVDYISMGALIHSVKFSDISLKVV